MTRETLIYRFWQRAHSKEHQFKAAMFVYVAEKNSYKTLSWFEFGCEVIMYMAYLKVRGIKKGDRVAICASNCPDWIFCDLAIQSLGAITVPVYPNTSAKELNDILNDSGAIVLFADDQEKLDKVSSENNITKLLFANLKDALINQTAVLEKTTDTTKTKISAAMHANYCYLNTYQELAYGAENYLDINCDDIVTLSYTSGSSGKPKGVMLSHDNIAAACDSLGRHGFEIREDDVILIGLSLAHIYDRVDSQFAAIWHGSISVHAKPKEIKHVLPMTRPTIMLSVPLIWREIKNKIEQECALKTGLQKWLIQLAFSNNSLLLPLTWLAGMFVFPAIKRNLGLDRARLMMSGGAGIPDEVILFFRKIKLLLYRGYGLTETAGALSFETPDDFCLGTVGHYMGCVVVNINEDQKYGPGHGEIFVSGDTVFKGYWNNPEATAKAFEGNCFKTGDLGRFDEHGHLIIEGRIGDTCKNEGGKFVHLGLIAQGFENNPLISYVIPIAEEKPYVVSLIFLNETACRNLLAQNGISLAESTTVAAEFTSNTNVHKIIDSSLEATRNATNAALEHWEWVQKIAVIPVIPSVDNGLLTSTLKIRQFEVLKQFADIVKKLYQSTGTSDHPKAA